MALGRLILSPHLTHLRIEGICDFPLPWILVNSPSLRVLTFGSSTRLSADVPPLNISQHASVPKSKLRYLSLSRPCSSKGWELLFQTKRPDGLPIVDITSLDRLNIAVDSLEVSERWLGSVQKLKKLALRGMYIFSKT
jgi:hypothetical protein